MHIFNDFSNPRIKKVTMIKRKSRILYLFEERIIATTISSQFKMFRQKTNQILTFLRKCYGVSHGVESKYKLDF